MKNDSSPSVAPMAPNLAGTCPSVVRSNARMRVAWNVRNGGLDSLVLADDPDEMNWIEGLKTWGLVRAFCPREWPESFWHYDARPYLAFQGLEERGEAVVSRYAGGGLALEVTRTLGLDALEERYRFTNTGRFPLYYLRGQIGILTTFNDSYGAARTCEGSRCHAHVFAQGSSAYVHARKMGPFPTDLVLTLSEGELDGYSQQIHGPEGSNDRGDLVLHPAPLTLLAGESKTVAWRVAPIRSGSFVPPVRAKFETCFTGETFEIEDAAGLHRVPADEPGELTAYGARLFVSDPPETVIRRRIGYILDHQQCNDPKSPLDGAFLVYDPEEDRQYFDERWRDHNASRERLGMGLLLARWLQTHPDEPRVRAALDRYEAFVFREFLDRATGATYDTIGKDPDNLRLYDAPWAITFLAELYRLKKDPSYLDVLERAMLDYYAKGGDHFYPNGCLFGEVLALLRDAGRDIAELTAVHRRHIDTILRNDIDYPAHEVRFEQTIVTPALGILASWWLHVDRDPAVRAAVERHLAVLERFDGDQPDYRSGGVPIRHWDGYWFGKLRSYGDTLHYWSALSASSYALYAQMGGDASYRLRAERCFRNLMSLFHRDGSASCAYYVPYSMTIVDDAGDDLLASVRGERPDPWCNDQDFALYYYLRFAEGSGVD